MPSRSRLFPQATLPRPSRSRQSGSRYRPAPVHLCPDPVPVPQTEDMWACLAGNVTVKDAISSSSGGPDSIDTRTMNTQTACRARTSAPQTELTPSRWPTADRCLRCGGCLLKHKPAWTASSLYSVVLTLAIEVQAHGTNHNILSRYRGITAKQTPVTAVTAGFQENVIPLPFPRNTLRCSCTIKHAPPTPSHLNQRCLLSRWQ